MQAGPAAEPTSEVGQDHWTRQKSDRLRWGNLKESESQAMLSPVSADAWLLRYGQKNRTHGPY